jgi:hypothetical protein
LRNKKNKEIDYELLVHDALRNVVKESLHQAADYGLPGDHHFYISFRTDYPGVLVPEYILEEYPEEITIVLQYEFWDLVVEDEFFSVTVSFNDEQESLKIPYLALVGFVDPSVKFGLQFTPPDPEDVTISIFENKSKKPSIAFKSDDDDDHNDSDDSANVEGNVIHLDFSKKKDT